MKGFVVFAEMRTGSNHLEESLNAMPGVTCHGEAFNENFVGHPGRSDVLGIDLATRRTDPARLLDAIAAAPGINGFRYFHDHDPRVFEVVARDPGWRKIVLTRDVLDSFVSLEIARATDQWRLTDTRRRKTASIRFDPARFEVHRAAVEGFAARRRRAIQAAGQTAFEIAYEEIAEPEVIAGLARFLGAERPARIGGGLLRQNPSDPSKKVSNYDEMLAHVGAGPARAPADEPERAAAVRSWRAGREAALIYMPVRSGPEDAVIAWLEATCGGLDGPSDQRAWRRWKRARPGHRAFTVVRHPVARAHHAFCSRILATGAGTFAAVRAALRRDHALPIPPGPPGPDWDAARQKAALLAWLRFVGENLDGRTAVRVDGNWAGQAAQVSGFSAFAAPDAVLREEELPAALDRLADAVGVPAAPYGAPSDPGPVPLRDYYDDEIEKAARSVYARDYMTFGFGPWR